MYNKSAAPNIKHYVSHVMTDGYANKANGSLISCVAYSTARYLTNSTGDAVLRAENWEFAASGSNSVYGSGNMIMPPSVDITMGLYLGRPA